MTRPTTPSADKAFPRISASGLPVRHTYGIIWRENPAQIVKQYLQWADSYQENQITLIYDTMWESTRKMSEAIAAGIRKADPSVTIKQFNLANSDKNDVLTQVFKSKAILVGSPTVNNGAATGCCVTRGNSGALLYREIRCCIW